MTGVDHINTLEAGRTVVLLRAARIPVIGTLAHHHWFVISRAIGHDRWEVWQRRGAGGQSWGYLHKNLLPDDSGVGNGPSWIVQTWTGEEAIMLAKRIERTPETYPWRDRYWAWPGPNSNTFAQWVLAEYFSLGWQGLGKRWRRRDRDATQ